MGRGGEEEGRRGEIGRARMEWKDKPTLHTPQSEICHIHMYAQIVNH